jgi:predicted transcriptional regulator
MSRDQVLAFLGRAAAEPVILTVADLMAVWSFRVRDLESSARVDADLSAEGLQCVPDFKAGNREDEVCVSRMPSTVTETRPQPSDDGAALEQAIELPAFTLLVRDIPSATGPLISANPNQDLPEVKFLMATKDFSQLPVLSGERNLKGYVSWRTIFLAELHKPEAATLKDATEPPPRVVYDTEELLDHVGTIYEEGFVFVRARDGRHCGIVTADDLARHFQDLTTPYFQIGQIEARLRQCISRAFPIPEIRLILERPDLESVSKMTVAEYATVLGESTRWERMHWAWVPRKQFLRDLDEVREVRNRVMHFGQQLEQADRIALKNFLKLMGTLVTPLLASSDHPC